jgi:ankyrin repeat protein
MSPIMHAAFNNKTIVFMYLAFKRKADLKKADKLGAKIIHWAAYSNAINVLKLMKHLPDAFELEARDHMS